MGWQDQVSDAPAAGPKAASDWRSQVVDAVPEVARDTKPVHDLVSSAPGMKDATNPYEGFLAGLQISSSVIPFHRPNLQVPNNAGFFTKLTGALGQGLGDLPANVAGFIGGAAGGGAAGAAAGAMVPVAGETGASEAVGGAVGAVAGAGFGTTALPQAIREVMTDYYRMKDQPPMSAREFLGMVASSSWSITKAGAIGMVGAGVGKVASVGIGAAGGTAFSQNAANIAGFAGGATGAQAAIEQKLPDSEDAAIIAITTLGFGAAGHVVAGRFVPNDAATIVANNHHEVFRQTGVPPWEQAHMGKQDPVLHQELVTHDVNGDPVLPKFNALRPEEPEPFSKSKLLGTTALTAPEGAAGPKSVVQHVEELLPQIRHLEGSGDHAISPAGAIGRYQIMPGTARQYGFDPAKLMDPVYNEQVARTILADLSRRFNGDTEAILVAYNAGPGRAFRFLRDGRNTENLPRETQKYLERGGFGGKGGEPPKPPPPPEEPPLLEGPEGKKPNFAALTLDSLRSRFQDAIGQEPSKPQSGNLMRQWVSELEAARGIDKEMQRQGLLDPSKDITTEEMFRQTYASDDRAQYMFTRGGIDAITLDHKDGPALLDVLAKIKELEGNVDDFNMYRVAARTVEKAAQGIDTGVFKGGVDEAGHILQRPELQKYKAINEMLQNWKMMGLEYGRDSGLWNQERMEKMQAANTSHVSLRRVMGDDAAFNAGSNKKGRGFRATNPLKKMEGSNRQIVEPLTADMDNLRRIIRMADRNRAIGHVIMSQEARGILGLKQLPAPEVKAMLAEPGSSVFKPYSMTPEQVEAFRPFAIEAKVGTKGSNRFTFFRDGVPEVWEAKDPNVAELMRGADSPGEADLIVKMLSLPAKFERAGIVAAPDFGFRNILTDQLSAWLMDPLHPPPYITTMRGVMDVLGKGNEFWDLMRRGGLSGAITEMDMAKLVDKAVKDQSVLQETGALATVWNNASHPLHFAQMIMERLTHMERVGYYKAAVAKGVDPNKAAMMARKAYLDFSEKGTSAVASKMAQIIPFFRAGLLGMKQFRDAVVDNPKQLLTRTALGLVVPQIALYVLNRTADEGLEEKDRYTSLPQWQRDHYFITPPIGGVRFRLARPFMIGPLVSVPVERFLEAAFEKDPHAFDDIVEALAGGVAPPIMPAAFRPILEQTANYNFFTGLPLISDALKDQTADNQYYENTSEVSKRISSALGGHTGLGLAEVSPIVLDNYVREWSGTVGAIVLHALDAPLGSNASSRDWKEMPFVRGFVVQNPRMGTKQIEDFYKDADKWTALHKDAVAEVKRGEMTQAMADATLVGHKASVVVRVEHALTVMHTALRAIEKNGDMTLDEKRQLSNRVYNDAWRVAEFGSRALRDRATEEEAQTLGTQVQSNLDRVPGAQ